MIRQVAPEEGAGRNEPVPQLDARLGGLILEDRERQGAQRVPGRRLEQERHLGAVAAVDAVAALGAVVRLHHALDLRRVVVPPGEVVRVARLAVQSHEALQGTDARVERPVEGLGRCGAVDGRDQCLPQPALLRERVPVGALLDLDVLPGEALVRHDLEAGLVPQVRERELRLRVDRVDLAGADRLDLGVRVRDEAEHDRVELRRLAVPPARVLRQRDT